MLVSSTRPRFSSGSGSSSVVGFFVGIGVRKTFVHPLLRLILQFGHSLSHTSKAGKRSRNADHRERKDGYQQENEERIDNITCMFWIVGIHEMHTSGERNDLQVFLGKTRARDLPFPARIHGRNAKRFHERQGA